MDLCTRSATVTTAQELVHVREKAHDALFTPDEERGGVH